MLLFLSRGTWKAAGPPSCLLLLTMTFTLLVRRIDEWAYPTLPGKLMRHPEDSESSKDFTGIRHKGVIAICACITSKSGLIHSNGLSKTVPFPDSTNQTVLQMLMIPSVERTITPGERDRFQVRLYLGMNDDDTFWLNHVSQLKVPGWLHVKPAAFKVAQNKIPFNSLMKMAFDEDADYLVRVNDDTQFLTPGWISIGVSTLEGHAMPNVGVVGPTAPSDENKIIMTHDMVHRTHLIIFKHYYPEVFSSWWIDDWMSLVYEPGILSTKLVYWKVDHPTEVHGQRYEVNQGEKAHLKTEIQIGRIKIHDWILSQLAQSTKLEESTTKTKLRLWRKNVTESSGTSKPKMKNVISLSSVDTFEIVVLAMNRAKSLKRLLDSLEATDYGGDDVRLVIRIDYSPDNNAVKDVADGFEFSHGPKTVYSATTNNGLRSAWFGAWTPSFNTTNLRNYAVIFEDDILVSPLWYQWLTLAWSQYGKREDVGGISLQRQTLVAQHPRKRMEIVNNHQPFLYTLVGSHGFSPHPTQWQAFLLWIDSIDLNQFDVSTPGLVTSDWWNALDKRQLWTQHFIFFCNQHALYTLYVNLPGTQALAAHMREKGEHYPGGEGQDFALATSVDMRFPGMLNKYGWNGLLEHSWRCVNPEAHFTCPDDPDKYCRGDINMIWSVGIGRGASPFNTSISGPIQTGQDVIDITGLFVADPFLVMHLNVWYVFSEIVDNNCQKAVIGYHFSTDLGASWSYGSVVLIEDWHLSFPFVIKYIDQFYMTTCATAGTVEPFSLWLYKATHFPRGWNKVVKILENQTQGRPLDPVLITHTGLWFLFVLDDGLQKERIFFSNSVFGPFEEHPKSTSFAVRQSGRIITDDVGMLWSFYHTSSTVHAVPILMLTAVDFEYGLNPIKILGPRDDLEWASGGMHTFNANQLQDGTWVVLVDGWWDDGNHKIYRCLATGETECQRVGISIGSKLEDHHSDETLSTSASEIGTQQTRRYAEWQMDLNEFEAKAKMHYFRPYVHRQYRCAEFGSSTGHILASLGCSEVVGIEVCEFNRRWAYENLGIKSVEHISDLDDETFDMVITTSVLEHVECPVCEVREIYRILKVGGTFVGTVPGMAPSSMVYTPSSIHNELQMFGSLEFGNIVRAAGLKVETCWSEMTQWPTNFRTLWDQVGEDEFIKLSLEWAREHDRLVTTICVATKQSATERPVVAHRDGSSMRNAFGEMSIIVEHVLSYSHLDWAERCGVGMCKETNKFFVSAAQRMEGTICLIGMRSGVESALFLMAGMARVHTFDVSDDIRLNIASYLNRQFDNRLQTHWGDFRVTLPACNLSCDLIFVNALFSQDIQSLMKHLTHSGTEFLIHNGYAGLIETKEYLAGTYLWEELGKSNTTRGDGQECVYHLGRRFISSAIATEIQKQFGFVFLQVFNRAFIPFVASWICQAKRIPDLLNQTLFVTTDCHAEQAVREMGATNILVLTFQSGDLSYGQRQYFDYMLFRSRIVQALLDNSVNVWLIEADSTWFANPTQILNRFTGLDVVVGQDGTLSEDIPQGGFIFLNATKLTQLMWSDMTEHHQSLLRTSVGNNLGNSGSEMLLLPTHLKKVEWTSFPRKQFVGGKWYSDISFREAVDPIVIQNNWIVGNKAKKDRAAQWGHWYVKRDGKTCKPVSPAQEQQEAANSNSEFYSDLKDKMVPNKLSLSDYEKSHIDERFEVTSDACSSFFRDFDADTPIKMFLNACKSHIFEAGCLRFGTDYGGHEMPHPLCWLQSGGIYYGVGTGEDISFDISMAHAYDVKVRLFDPTPRAIRHVEAVLHALDTRQVPSSPISHPNLYYHDGILQEVSARVNATAYFEAIICSNFSSNIEFRPWALAVEDGNMSFFAPASGGVSHSLMKDVGNGQTDQKGMKFSVVGRELSSIMAEFGDEHLSVLKIDIEGYEVYLIPVLLQLFRKWRHDRWPRILLVDMDSMRPGHSHENAEEGHRCVELLNQAGYSIFASKDYDFTFILEAGSEVAENFDGLRNVMHVADLQTSQLVAKYVLGDQKADSGAKLRPGAVLARVLSLNFPDWAVRFGGLGICPGTHGFFQSAAQDVQGAICEIGMGSGVSAALFLMATTTARVHTFDLGSETPKQDIVIYLNEQFEDRLQPHWGDFYETIPYSNMKCDLIFVDALHPHDVEVSMAHLTHADTQYLYHNGGEGSINARDYLLSTFDSWEELATSDTPRDDNKRCVYYLGRKGSDASSDVQSIGVAHMHAQTQSEGELEEVASRFEEAEAMNKVHGRELESKSWEMSHPALTRAIEHFCEGQCQHSSSFYVVSLQGVLGAHANNAGRLDGFLEHFNSMCGGKLAFKVCPGVLDERRGFGVTQAFINCLETALHDGSDFVYIFEDDARLVSAKFCDAAIHGKLLEDLPNDVFVLMLGGHHWRFGAPAATNLADRFKHVVWGLGAYGFGIPRSSLSLLRNAWIEDLKSSTAEVIGLPSNVDSTLSPDTTWYTYASKCGKLVYATNPLVVKHPPGWSNTWKKFRTTFAEDDMLNTSLHQNLHGEQHPSVAINFPLGALVLGKKTREMRLQFVLAGLVPGFMYEVVVEEVHLESLNYIQFHKLVLSSPSTFGDARHVTMDLSIVEHQAKYRFTVTVLDMFPGLTRDESLVALKRVLLPLKQRT